MKTFDDIKQDILMKKIEEKKLCEELLENAQTNEEQVAAKIQLRNINEAIDNIEEVTIMEIGRDVNGIIKGFKSAFEDKSNKELFFNNFDKFCDNILKDENSNYKVDVFLNELGVSKNDLNCLKGSENINPGKLNYGDNFRNNINVFMGTNIPMADDLVNARQFYYETNQSDNAYVNLMEMMRDAGELNYLLSTDEEYNNRIENISGKKI